VGVEDVSVVLVVSVDVVFDVSVNESVEEPVVLGVVAVASVVVSVGSLVVVVSVGVVPDGLVDEDVSVEPSGNVSVGF